MKGFLLDANLLLALAWPNHAQHAKAHEWFRAEQAKGWGTCLVTQLAFVRVSSNSAVPHRVSPSAAFALLAEIMARPHHHFWPEPSDGCRDPALAKSLAEVLTHNFVTDCYLATLAGIHGGKLATLDRQLARAFPQTILI